MAIGAMFGGVLNLGKELDAATKQLVADTGMTATEAGIAEKALAGMYGNNLQGFDQIGAAMAVVINGLDLTGTAADLMTEKFLKFATATGQDAAPAVSSFHELLNAWNLTADAAPGIMDKLIASHQKYGSVVTENEDALRRLAPQMTALGMNVDDTIGLLNLFDAAGMDSAKATFALNTAVKNLKPGQTLNDLIKQITSIQDPTERAQEAIKVFGARGGVNLANALKPGITSLDDFKTSADENADATTKAAAAIESGFGAQATLILHRFGGALADVATNFGPFLMAAALLGPKFTMMLTSGLGGLAGAFSKKIVGAIVESTPAVVAAGEAQGAAVGAAEGTAAGTAAGRTFGAAFAVAVAIGVTAAVLAPAIISLQDQLEANNKLAEQSLTEAEIRAYKWSKMDEVTRQQAARHGFGQPENYEADLKSALAKLDQAAADQIEADKPKVEAAANATVSAVVAIVGKTPGEIASALHAERGTLQTEWTSLLDGLKHQQTPAQEKATLIGRLASKALRKGLESGDSEVKAGAQQLKDDMTKRLAELDGKPAGEQLAQTLADGMAGPEAAKDINKAVTTVMGWLAALFGKTLTPASGGGGSAGGGGSSPITPGQGFAMGTPSVQTSGFYRVGERGPEDIYLPRGAAVVPNERLGAGTQNFYFGEVRPKTEQDAARVMRRIASVGALG
jgi:hypothetical protein